uniref:CLIP domain-containing serine protease n=1 Tax=Stomoxys calcitrans TaxID=35570 RepID=A0A1I8P6J9_STOCA
MGFEIRIVILVISLIKTSLAHNIVRCTKPSSAFCIPLNKCPLLYDLYKNFEQLGESEQRLLRDSQCGFDNTHEGVSRVLVCCPDETAMPDEEPSNVNAVNEMLLRNFDIDNAQCGLMENSRATGRDSAGRNGADRRKVSSVDGSYFPWMALIEYMDIRDGMMGSYNCSGTLINSRYILTAAHCMSDTYWKPHRIWLGHWEPNTDIQCLTQPHDNAADCAATKSAFVSEIDEIIIYPTFHKNIHHDVALIRMKQRVENTKAIRPICLPFGYDFNTADLTNTMAEFVSWSGSSKTEGLVNADKTKILLPIWETSECRKTYRLKNRDIHLQYEICAGGEQDVDTCNGDSGGGLVHSFERDSEKVHVVVGIMAAGTRECGLEGWPSISIHVQHHLQWILHELARGKNVA